jgi:D-methionine transport system ATP-binding protein
LTAGRADPPRIQLIDLEKTFTSDAGAHPAVRGVSLSIAPGEVFGIIGESGAGKSTLIRLINLLERPDAGQILIDGEDVGALNAEGLRRLRRRVGMIFQHFNLLSSKTVAENVAFPLQLEGRLGRAEIKARVAELLGRVGLSRQADAYPAKLSGGQKQRVGIARALACGPTVLLCDEATSALDPETTRQVLALLAELNRELGLTIVLITHEMDVVRQVCDRVAVLEAGRVVEAGDVVDVFLSARHAVTRRLLGQDDEPPPPGMGRKVRLTYRGDAAQIKGEPYGQLTLSLDGAAVDDALARFAEAGIHVRELAA